MLYRLVRKKKEKEKKRSFKFDKNFSFFLPVHTLISAVCPRETFLLIENKVTILDNKSIITEKKY